MTPEAPVDSADPRVAEHIRRFLETGGRPRPGVDDLLLTTRGRRSGRLRRTVLVYVRDGGDFVVTASNRGADTHPAWYLNLVAEPRVRVRVGTEEFDATAREADPRDRDRLWERMAAAMPAYRAYEEATDRVIPVVVLTPANRP